MCVGFSPFDGTGASMRQIGGTKALSREGRQNPHPGRASNPRLPPSECDGGPGSSATSVVPGRCVGRLRAAPLGLARQRGGPHAAGDGASLVDEELTPSPAVASSGRDVSARASPRSPSSRRP
jgi:hypothetical protein